MDKCCPGGTRPGGNPFNPVGRGRRISPSAAPMPTPPPISCEAPDAFDECFTGCAGSIPPGTVCGWTDNTLFINPGSAAFDGDQAIFTFPPGPSSGMSMIKSLLVPSPTPPLSLHWTMTELPDAPGDASTGYFIPFSDAGGAGVLFAFLANDGSVLVGTPAASGSGIWTPSPGATSTFHLTFDGAIFELFQECVPIPLAPGAGFPFPLPASSLELQVGRGAAVAMGTMSWDSVFVNQSVDPCDTVYCCPDGSPAN